MVEVEPGPGDGAFAWRKRDRSSTGYRSGAGGAGPGAAAQEPALWVQPLQWMDGVVNDVQGKINCPGCGRAPYALNPRS